MFFLDSEINTLTLNQLKNYLRRYNQNVTGKKAELTLRAKGVSKLVKADVICGKAPTSQFERRHTEKLVNPRGEKLPAPFSLVNWVKDLLKIPHFTEGDIYNYFVLKMGIKKSLRAKVYYTDRHVYDIQYWSISYVCDHCFVKCK